MFGEEQRFQNYSTLLTLNLIRIVAREQKSSYWRRERLESLFSDSGDGM